MKLLDFMNTEKNWRKILSSPPYNIKITEGYAQNGTYVILKYNQLSSDFNELMVRQARGSIFFQDDHTKVWECVCHPFDKFGNYGESYVPEIDWSTARVQEKVDGSLIKIWYHGGWHISTNGTINARHAMCQNNNYSYHDLVMRALKKYGNPEDFFNALYPEVTYMFELVSPDNRMTIAYPEDRLYLIGARDKDEDFELETDWIWGVLEHHVPGMIKKPKSYPLQTLEECIAAVEVMGCDEEGFVVCDDLFHRVKVKSPAYLYASHLRFNNSITTKKVVKIIRDGALDDFVAYNADYKEKVDLVLEAGRVLAATMEEVWTCYKDSTMLPANKREFFEMVRNSRYCDFYCKKYDNKFELTAAEWLNRQPVDTITEWLEEEIVNLLTQEAKQ